MLQLRFLDIKNINNLIFDKTYSLVKRFFMKKKLCFLILISFLSVTRVFGQDDDVLPDPEEPNVPSAPINDYLPLLILAGTAYSFRKLNKKKINTILQP